MPFRPPCLLLVTAFALGAVEVPYGHRDFYPSAERPVGFRGDGNGHFPGATPVTRWAEGTLSTRSFTYQSNRSEKTEDAWDFAEDGAINVVWRTRMPGWVNGHPIVVGDRVFTACEPWLLTCVDAHSGDILWTRVNSPWHGMGLPEAEAERCAVLGQLAFHFDNAADFFKGAGDLSPDQVPPVAQLLADSGLASLYAVLQKADPKGSYDGLFAKAVEQMRALASGTAGDKKGDRYGSLKEIEKAISARLEQACGQKVPSYSWGTMVGDCMSIPVSDGHHVFVTTGRGATACFDLAGNKVWSRWIDPEMRAVNTTMIQSPLIAGDILVVNQKKDPLIGLDKHTGKTVWEAPTQAQGIKTGGGYYVGSHKVLWLGEGADRQAFIVTTLCNIIRARDGKVVGSLPYRGTYGPSGGPPICASGNIVYKGSSGDGGGDPLTAYELELVDEDTVRATELWQGKQKIAYTGLIATPGHLILPSFEGQSFYEARTGKAVGGRPQSKGLVPKSGHFTLAGNIIITLPSGHHILDSSWGRRRSDGKTLIDFHLADISDPDQPRSLTGRPWIRTDEPANVLGTADMPPMYYLEQWAPELAACPDYLHGRGGMPGHFIHTDTAVFPSGNRLFIRSVDALYCIGDPSEKYDWNPASRPAEIGAALER